MGLKVSISLHGDTVITFESDEPQLYKEIVGLALRELPRDLMQMQAGSITSKELKVESKNVTPGESPVVGKGEDRDEAGGPDGSEQASRRTEPEEAYARFCGSLSPLGDMRRVVVAAEGASRFLGVDGVSEKELVPLYDLAGWRQPGQFLQSLRNAARSKFRWLERVHGRAGYYSVTQTGKDKVIQSLEG